MPANPLSRGSAPGPRWGHRPTTPHHSDEIATTDATFLALTASNSSLITPALLRAHSFVFFAVLETRRIFLSPFILKSSGSELSYSDDALYINLLYIYGCRFCNELDPKT